MFREVKQVRQDNPDGHRRWFESDFLELIVWYSAAGALTGFQILYGKGLVQRALTWRSESGYSHSRIDDGDSTPFKNCTPVLVPDGPVPWAEIVTSFREQAASLEPPIRDAVLSRIGNYS